ncbi:GPI-anchored protein [Carex littledalei]|uniref:GPI-anchored protein n=1 Tax=Carex littledalei TaxID=544730 RepID=A0A833VSL1_9POAL|nr:GPI-anchored protein [Carex littledalei]
MCAQTLVLLLFLSLFSLSQSLPAIPDPSLVIPSTTDTNTTDTTPSTFGTTIPAFPEQSDVASHTCPLNPNDALLPSLSTSCNPASSPLSLSKCCPSLAAYLYAAYAATSLQATAASSISTSTRPDPLPVLPDDAEACSGAVDRVLREKGVELPRGNGTCDLALCGCGVKLRRMTCQSGMFADVEGMWVPVPGAAKRLERNCARPGLTRCGRCLRALNLLKTSGGNTTAIKKMKETGAHEQECQLMGLTWLLMRNGTRYLPAATGALRALIAADLAGSKVDPTTCSLSTDNLPLAVGSEQLNGQDSSSSHRLLAPTSINFPLVFFVWLLLVRAMSL